MRVGCPECGAASTVSDDAAGKTVPCPTCKAPMVLPVPVVVDEPKPLPVAKLISQTKIPVAKRIPAKPRRDEGYEVLDEPPPRRIARRKEIEDEDAREVATDYVSNNSDTVGWLVTACVAVVVILVLLIAGTGTRKVGSKGSAASSAVAPKLTMDDDD